MSTLWGFKCALDILKRKKGGQIRHSSLTQSRTTYRRHGASGVARSPADYDAGNNAGLGVQAHFTFCL